MRPLLIAAALAGALTLPAARAADPLDSNISAIAKAWDHAEYELTQKDAQITAFHRVEAAAEALAKQNPTQAEPLVWDAIALSSEAGVEGGLGALTKVTRARDLLLSAEKLNPNALGDGSIYSSLGSLYYQVPGFPIGFGDKKRARDYLQRALAESPSGIETNFFMGDFLVREGEYARAIECLNRALAAPARPGREVGDQGRRRDAAALLAKARAQLHQS